MPATRVTHVTNDIAQKFGCRTLRVDSPPLMNVSGVALTSPSQRVHPALPSTPSSISNPLINAASPTTKKITLCVLVGGVPGPRRTNTPRTPVAIKLITMKNKPSPASAMLVNMLYFPGHDPVKLRLIYPPMPAARPELLAPPTKPPTCNCPFSYSNNPP
jgi:hypothetical protein